MRWEKNSGHFTLKYRRAEVNCIWRELGDEYEVVFLHVENGGECEYIEQTLHGFEYVDDTLNEEYERLVELFNEFGDILIQNMYDGEIFDLEKICEKK